MKTKHAILILATFAAASAFAQGTGSPSTSDSSTGGPQTSSSGTSPGGTYPAGASSAQSTAPSSGGVTSSSGQGVTSGTGMAVTPGAASTSVAVTPSTASAVPAMPAGRMLPGAATVQASSTTVLGGPAGPGVSGTQTVVTRYWVNVPANVTGRRDFQRWMALH
jgi:hypothetical protein